MNHQSVDLFRHYCNLGYDNPYYIVLNGKIVVEPDFAEALEASKEYEGNVTIDPIAIIELLNTNFCLADRTMIQGIYRTPWQAKPNEEMTDWYFAPVPVHGNSDLPEKEVAEELFKRICNEIRSYIGNKKKIGILLSGGMDSRMVAGALDYLKKSGELGDIIVTGLTWGNENTRDVVYAQEICRRLGWRWKHYIVTTDDLIGNISETAAHGCEYSPIHLHAIPRIRDDNDDMEIILAGSYGDSIGRAEYSGKHVEHLRPIAGRTRNIWMFVYKDVYKELHSHIKDDIELYHRRFPGRKGNSQNELDYQLHYMRRMLNPCMELLNKKIEFHQVFTDPSVFGYMWSIKPDKRNNLVYKNMLKLFVTKLDDIPWARTGLPFYKEDGIPDNYSKNHHDYQRQIYEIFYNKIDSKSVIARLDKLNVIDTEMFKNWLSYLRKIKYPRLEILEKLLWLVSLSEMVENYGIKGIKNHHNASICFHKPSIQYMYMSKNIIQNTKSCLKGMINR